MTERYAAIMLKSVVYQRNIIVCDQSCAGYMHEEKIVHSICKLSKYSRS
jgi:hypothetical protein